MRNPAKLLLLEPWEVHVSAALLLLLLQGALLLQQDFL
jgi:hypothetical protein